MGGSVSSALFLKTVAFGSLISTPISVQSPFAGKDPFDGSWVADLDTQSGLGSDVYLVSHGLYACKSCEPPRSYPADGKPHPVPGDPDVTFEAVTISGSRSIVTHIVGPPLDRTTNMTVAPNNRTATYISMDHRPGIKAALRTEYLARRTAPAPVGAHPVSGTWRGIRYVAVPALVRTTTLRLAGDRFSYSTPLGTSFTAQLGSGYVPVQTGGAGGAMVAVSRSGTRRIEEKVKWGGQLVTTRTFTVARDGRSIEIATTDISRGTTFRAISRRVVDGGS